MLSLDRTMIQDEIRIQRSRNPGPPHLLPCLCGAVFDHRDPHTKIRIIAPTAIGGKDHPARGLVIGMGYIGCKNCGIHAAKAKTLKAVITNWNELTSRKKPHLVIS